MAVVQISGGPLAKTRCDLFPRLLGVGAEGSAAAAAADEDLILLASELAGAHVEVRALLVVFFAEIVGRIGDEIELIICQILPVLTFEAVLVQPHEAGVFGDPGVLAPIVGDGKVCLSSSTAGDWSTGLAIVSVKEKREILFEKSRS